MAQRIKGQDTFITITKDNQLQARIDSVQSSDIEFMLDLLEEGYLGETANRYDSIFNGISVTIELHATNGQILELADAIVARAQRRVGGATRIDVAGSFSFPNGEFPTLVISDVFFESIPVSTGARDEYTQVTLTGSASEYKII